MQAWHEPLPDGRAVELRATARLEGDLAVDGPGAELAARRAAIVARPWVWLRQVHGREVVVVGDGDDPHALAGTAADAVVTDPHRHRPRGARRRLRHRRAVVARRA